MFLPNSGSGSGSDKESNNLNSLIWLIIPFALVVLLVFGIILRWTDISISKIKKYINRKIIKYKNKEPKYIVKGKLSKKFIKKLNSNNNQILNDNECPICLDTMNKSTIILNCGHKFHKKCLQNWVKTQTSNYTNPICPLDRIVIINIPKVEETSYSSGSDYSYNSDYD